MQNVGASIDRSFNCRIQEHRCSGFEREDRRKISIRLAKSVIYKAIEELLKSLLRSLPKDVSAVIIEPFQFCKTRVPMYYVTSSKYQQNNNYKTKTRTKACNLNKK